MAPSNPLPGKVVITGCDSGIGREFAMQYARDGRDTVATYLDLANRIAADTPGLAHRQLDVTSQETVADLARQLDGAGVSLLICNAGLKSDGRPTDAPDFDAMRRLFDVNALGALRVSVALLANLAAAAPARIVLVSSRLGGIGSNLSGGHVGYRASKAALNAIGRTMAVDLRPRGISVTMLHPGWVRTPNGGDMAPLSVSESVAMMRQTIARLGSHETGEFLSYQGQPLAW